MPNAVAVDAVLLCAALLRGEVEGCCGAYGRGEMGGDIDE